MKRNKILNVTTFVISIATIIFLIINYKTIPDVISTHFRIDGTADSFANKSQLWFFVAILVIVNFVIYLSHSHIIKLHEKDSNILETRKSWRIKRTYPALNLLITILISYTIIKLILHNKAIKAFSVKSTLILTGLLLIIFIIILIINSSRYKKHIMEDNN